MKHLIVGIVGLLGAFAPLESEAIQITAQSNAQETSCAPPAANCAIIIVPPALEDTVAYSWSWVIEEMTQQQLLEMYESEFIIAQDL